MDRLGRTKATGAWPPQMASRDFWANYFMVESRRWPRDSDSQPLTAAVTLPIADAHALVIDVFDSNVDLFIEPAGAARAKLGWNDSAHWHPDVFRWEETRAICAHLAGRGPEFQHPGVPLLLLCLFTPVTDDDDYSVCYADVCDGLSLLQLFSEREVELLARRGLRELDEGARWCESSLGYELAGDSPVYTLRRAGTTFPFEDFRGMLAACAADPGRYA